jgi:AcrR family transcriptional regulator
MQEWNMCDPDMNRPAPIITWDTDSSIQEDVRARVDRERRDRMRARLVDAAMKVYAEKKHLPFVVDDVIKMAGVARGSFYKYFVSLDDLITFAGAQLANEVVRETLALGEVVERPIYRTAIGLRLHFSRAIIDPNWAAFVGRTGHVGNDNIFEKRAVFEYTAGKEAGDFRFDCLETVLDITLGAMASCIRRLSSGVVVGDYIGEASLHILAALGARDHDAAEAITAATVFVQQFGPSMSWWQEIGGTASV